MPLFCLDKLPCRPEYVEAQGLEALGMGGSMLEALHTRGGLSLSPELTARLPLFTPVLPDSGTHVFSSGTLPFLPATALFRPEYVEAQGLEALGMGGSMLEALHREGGTSCYIENS
jgi:hypothetical protein